MNIMSEDKSIFGNNPKTSFLLGLFAGIAVFSTISASILMIALFTGGQLKIGSAEQAADVAAAPADVQAADEEADLVDVPAVTADDNAIGPDDAKITLIEYSDFECPYCQKHQETLEQILEEYGDDVRLVFRHFPLSFHANARSAALAAECAAEQGKFWEMHDLIFEANVNGEMGTDQWKDYAKDLGLNTGKFNECLDSEKYAEKINEQMQDGMAAGVRGTPATFVNGGMVSGALPYDTFKQILDQELAYLGY